MIRTPGLLAFQITVFFLLAINGLYSQFSHSIHYTTNEGLPSSRVYDMIQDSSGYIWFATENGVSRFDGFEFENFTTADGLPTNSTLRLYEDYRGRIWFLSYQGAISYYKNGQIRTLGVNKYLTNAKIPFMSNLYIDTNEVMYLSPFNGGLYELKPEENLKLIEEIPYVRSSVYFYLARKSNGHILAYVKPRDEFLNNEQTIIQTGDEEFYIHFDIDRSEHHYGYAHFPEHYLLSIGKKVYQISEDKLEHSITFKQEIIGIGDDRNGNAWVSEKFNGVFQYKNGIQEQSINQFLAGHSVSKVLNDQEGNYWFSTTQNGVFFVPSLVIYSQTANLQGLKNDVVLTFDIFNDKIFFTTEGKEVYHATINGNKLSGVIEMGIADELVNNAYAILAISENSFYATADPSIEMYHTVEVIRKNNLNCLTVEYGYDIMILKNGDLAVPHANGLKIIRDNQVVYNYGEFNEHRIFTVEEAPDSSLILGSIGGLYSYRDSVYSRLFPDDTILSKRISALEYNDDWLWVGTFDNGLALIHHDSIYNFNVNDGLSSNRIKSLYVENDSVAWVGTNRGLNRIHLNQQEPSQSDIDILDIWDGLPSNEINKIGKHETDIWIGTDKGLASFKPADIGFKHVPAKVYITDVKVDGWEDINPLTDPELTYDQNNISIDYTAVCFRNPRATTYYYQLMGLNSNWNETRNRSVRFHGLPPGEYTFLLKAENASGVVSDEVRFFFRVRKHFTQTTLFWVFLLIASTILIWFIVLYLLKSQRKRAELQRQIHLAEQKAMLAQMNPHFIFNSLNSIQNFILDNDSENANVYLVTFSSLIRKVLDISQMNFISLREELETVGLYLKLEKFRFGEAFDYHIKVNKGINTDNVHLPSMILQPYLENAIWHGIVPKQDHGLLQLTVAQTDSGGFLISIIDDGIGREKARLISQKRKHHKPTGIKNVEERIHLLNTLNKTNMRVEIKDLYDDSGMASGTMVKIVLDNPQDQDQGGIEY